MSRSVSAPSSVTKTSPCWYGDIVPGSTFRYGSIFSDATESPRAARIRPSDAAVMPFPREEVTPPVTNTNFGTGADLRGFSNDTGALVEAERERVEDHEARTFGAAGRRELGHLDRLLDAAVVEPRVEAKRAEPRVDEHTA